MPCEREDLLDPLNELLAYMDPNETVAQLMTRVSNFNKALFDRILDIDSFVRIRKQRVQQQRRQ